MINYLEAILILIIYENYFLYTTWLCNKALVHTQPSIILYYNMYMYYVYLVDLLTRETFNFCVMYFICMFAL